LFDFDRSADPVAIAGYDKAVADVVGGSYANTIKVQILAVLPQLQRSGIGKAFMAWCTRHAIKEGVPAVGKATVKAVPLYINAGAEVVGTIEMEPKTIQPEGTDVAIDLPRLDVPVIKFGAISTMQQPKC
jgi:GNAT superfamily N-acetyltransferase